MNCKFLSWLLMPGLAVFLAACEADVYDTEPDDDVEIEQREPADIDVQESPDINLQERETEIEQQDAPDLNLEQEREVELERETRQVVPDTDAGKNATDRPQTEPGTP